MHEQTKSGKEEGVGGWGGIKKNKHTDRERERE